MQIISRHFKMIMAFSLIYLTSDYIHATVVMTGTRIIFPINLGEQKIQFKNKDDIANIVQVWLDRGDSASSPDTADAPFIANPSIFKIHPQQGQIIRLLFSGDLNEYPTDQEKLYFLNFSVIPTHKKSDSDKNKLLFVIKNRVKVFLRPNNLTIAPHEIGSHIYYKITRNNNDHTLTLINKSPYHANISHATTNLGQQNLEIQELSNSILEPFSTLDSRLNTNNISHNFAINIGLINDYGVIQAVAVKPLQE